MRRNERESSSSSDSDESMFSKSIDDVDEASSENLTKDLFDQFDSLESSRSTVRSNSESLKKYFKNTNWYYHPQSTTQGKRNPNSVISKEIASASKNCSNSNFPISNLLTTKNSLILNGMNAHYHSPMASQNIYSNHVPTLVNKPSNFLQSKNGSVNRSGNNCRHSTHDPSVNSKSKPNFGLRNACITNSPLLATVNCRQMSRDLNSNFSRRQPLSTRSSNTPNYPHNNLIKDQYSFKENQAGSIRGTCSESLEKYLGKSESYHSSPKSSNKRDFRKESQEDDESSSSESLAKYFKPLPHVKPCNQNLIFNYKEQMRLPMLKNSNSIQSKNTNVLPMSTTQHPLNSSKSFRNLVILQQHNKCTPNINPMAFNKPIDHNMYNKRALIQTMPQTNVHFLYNNSQRNILLPQTVRKHNFIGFEVVDPNAYIRKHDSELINNSQLPNLDITKWVELNKNDILPSNARLVSKKLRRV